MIGHGIDVYYENNHINTVLFPDGRNICYHAGNMLLEMAKEETRYLLIEKLKKMIHGFVDQYAMVRGLEIF